MLRAGVIAIRTLFNQNMSIFTQCLNPLTGVASWEEKDQFYDYHQEVARSAFADMLHDHERVSILLLYHFILLLNDKKKIFNLSLVELKYSIFHLTE